MSLRLRRRWIFLAIAFGILSLLLAARAHAAQRLDFAPAIMVAADATPPIPANIDSADNVVAFGKLLLNAAQHHDTQLVLGLVLLIVVLVTRKLAAFVEAQTTGRLAAIGAALKSPWGGRALAFLWSAIGALSAVEMAHEHVTATVVWSIVSTGVVAAGSWSVLIEPLLRLFWAPSGKAFPTPKGSA